MDRCEYCGHKKNCWFLADGEKAKYPCKEPEEPKSKKDQK
jgi:hypothetical protein